MYAIVRDRGKQYEVRPGGEIDLDRIEVGQDDSIDFDEVLFYRNEDDIRIGTPTVEGIRVRGQVIDPEWKGRKVIVFKFRRRKDSKTRRGHRQRYTRVRIESIEAE